MYFIIAVLLPIWCYAQNTTNCNDTCSGLTMPARFCTTTYAFVGEITATGLSSACNGTPSCTGSNTLKYRFAQTLQLREPSTTGGSTSVLVHRQAIELVVEVPNDAKTSCRGYFDLDKGYFLLGGTFSSSMLQGNDACGLHMRLNVDLGSAAEINRFINTTNDWCLTYCPNTCLNINATNTTAFPVAQQPTRNGACIINAPFWHCLFSVVCVGWCLRAFMQCIM